MHFIRIFQYLKIFGLHGVYKNISEPDRLINLCRLGLRDPIATYLILEMIHRGGGGGE